MKRRLLLLFGFTAVTGAMIILPAGAAQADTTAQAMAAHMRLFDAGNRGMLRMMEAGDMSVACMNMMEAPPFGGDSPHG